MEHWKFKQTPDAIILGTECPWLLYVGNKLVR